MEYADGGTLQNYLKEHFGSLTWRDKFNLALQLAYTVSCLHDEGIVHLDLVHNFTNNYYRYAIIINNF
jgi:serine/threonine protein kinase